MSVNVFQKWHKRGLFEGILLLHNDRAAYDGISGVSKENKIFKIANTAGALAGVLGEGQAHV